MATRSRVGFKNSDGTVNASYVHFDGYLEGVGIALQYNHNNDSAAKKLGYAKGIRSIEADTPVSFYGDMDNEVYESEDDFYNSYDVDYAYLYDPARGWLFASEEYDTPGFIELEDQLLADEIVPGSGERTDDISEDTDYDERRKKESDYYQEEENTNDDLHDQLNDMMRDMDGEDLDDFLSFYAPEIDNTDANAITDWVYNLDDNDVLTIITDLQDYAELGLKESGKKLDIDARDTLEDEAALGLEERIESAVKENIVKDTIKNTMSKKYMFNPILGLAGAVYDKVMGKLDKDKIKDEDDLVDSINADPKLSKEEKLAAIEHIKKDPELAKALVGDNDDFDWKSYEDEQKKSKSFANFMGKWFNKIMTGDTLIQGNFLDPMKILDKLDAKKNKKDPDLKSFFDKEKEKEDKAASTVDKKRKEMSDETPPTKTPTKSKDWSKASDEELEAIGASRYKKGGQTILVPPKDGWPEEEVNELKVGKDISATTKDNKKVRSKSDAAMALKESEKIYDPVRGNTLKEHFNRFK